MDDGQPDVKGVRVTCGLGSRVTDVTLDVQTLCNLHGLLRTQACGSSGRQEIIKGAVI